jgi:predicted enzyme related to lactoylglutathione lyase
MRRIPQPYRHGELVIVIDCSDLDRSARFWTEVLGYTAGAATGGRYRTLTPEAGAGIEVLLQRTADAKQGKNHLHLDLRTADLAAEVSRVLGLGASLLTDRPVVEDGLRWHILADPDGNEFCVLQPEADSDQAALRALAAGPATREP